MLLNIVNTIGLGIDITGAIIIAKNGLPPDLSVLTSFYEILIKEDKKKEVENRIRMADIGLYFLITGFFLQIVASFGFGVIEVEIFNPLFIMIPPIYCEPNH